MGSIQFADLQLSDSNGSIQFTELVISTPGQIQFTGLQLAGTTTGQIQFTGLQLSGPAVGAPSMTANTNIADAGQVVTLTGAGGLSPYSWTVVSMSGGITAPTITPAGNTLSATVTCRPSQAGHTMVIGMTPTSGSQLTVTITVLASSILTRISSVEKPSWMETRLP